MRRTGTAMWRRALQALLAALVVLQLAPPVPAAEAVTARGSFSITVTPNTTRSSASYTLGEFRTGNGETVTGYTLTFPSDTNASGATSPGAGDVVSVAADTRTVTVVLGTPVAQRTNFDIVLGNVLNPSTAGPYSVASVTFTCQGSTNQTVNISAKTYTIVAAPYISMTIETPDAGQSVDFGTVDPGVTVAGKQVRVTVTSSAGYTMSRTIGGDATLLGLSVTGGASGPGGAGTTAYTDNYAITPPWTTDPEVPLTATVTYTVTQ